MSKWLAWVLVWVAMASAQPAAEPRLVVQTGHTTQTAAIAVSADGRLAATAGQDGTARVWDLKSGRELVCFGRHTQPPNSLALCPTQRWLATGSNDGQARVFDITTGQLLQSLRGDHHLKSVAFSPDGRQLLAGTALWDLATRREVRRFDDQQIIAAAAFSPDGQRVVTAGWDGVATVWDRETGQALGRLKGHGGSLTAVAFSPDGHWIASGGEDRTARLWDAATLRQVHLLSGHTEAVRAVCFSPDSRTLVTGSDDHTARTWSVASGTSIRSLSNTYGAGGFPVRGVACTSDGRQLLTAGWNGAARVWDLATGTESRRLQGGGGYATLSVAFRPDSAKLVSGGPYATIREWDLLQGAAPATYQAEGCWAAGYLPDGRRLLTAGVSEALLWDTSTSRVIRRFATRGMFLLTAVPSADGRQLFTASYDGPALIWDLETGRQRLQLPGQQTVSAAFGPDGRWLATTGYDGRGLLWDTATGQQIRSFTGVPGVWVVAVHPDGQRILTQGDTGAAIRQVATGRQLCPLVGHDGAVCAAAFSPDGRSLVTGGWDNTVRLWDVQTGQETKRLAGHLAEVTSTRFSPDGRWLATGSKDGSTRLWSAATGQTVCSLYSFTDGTWAVVAPDGRFDTNNLEEVKGLHWVLPNDPLSPLPLEVFMRDYYEPRLLSRLLAGERMAAVRPLSGLNTAQPEVGLTAVEPGADNTATIKVTVAGAPDRVRTGRCAEDLRLFRDGQLVGHVEGRLPLDTQGAYHGTFSVRVPRRAGLKSLQLSAYCFNDDRVKSATARTSYAPPQPPAPVAGRALVLAVGVNTYGDAGLQSLQYAAADAIATRDSLVERLTNSRAWSRVDSVLLTSTTERQLATRDNVKLVLDRLAGRPVDAARLAAITAGAEVPPARPEDLLVIAWSGHGDRDAGGTFYLLPSDVGPSFGAEDPRSQARAVSSSDLSRWLQDVDAGEIALVIDACHSEAAVADKGFKPGPLGCRGLGQLAYDKGLTLLAASRAGSEAREYSRLRHSLLTYALVTEGLTERRAAVDGRITLGGWLDYGCARAPRLEAELGGAGTTQAKNSTRRGGAIPQQPVLFRFRKSPTEVVLEAGRPPR